MNNKLKWGSGISLAAAAIIGTVLNLEGGYVNNPRDPGGETNHGVTVQVARDNGYVGSMRDLPVEFAQQVYYDKYIVKPGFLPMVAIQPAVAEELIDTGINTGPARPSRWFQQTLNALSNSGKSYPQINVDGRVGPNTIKTYQSLEKVRGRIKACHLTLKMLDGFQAAHYVAINNPTFTVGWFDHRIGNVPLEKCK